MTAVLFTCAGQRVDIVTAFGRAGATTIAADLDRLAPALYHADHMALVPTVDDPGYLPALAALVAEYDVKLVVPVTDIDQSILARGRELLEPALLLAPPFEVCATMADKYVAHVFFEEHGIESPRTWLPGDVPDDARYPAPRQDPRRLRLASHLPGADARPSSTSSSPHAGRVDGAGAVRRRGVLDRRFCDLDGRCLNAIPRTMLQSKGGESIKGMSLLRPELIAHGARVAETIGIVGPANVQCFREPDGSLPVTDVNPRFGGRVPASTRCRQPLPRARPSARARRDARAALGEFSEACS